MPSAAGQRHHEHEHGNESVMMMLGRLMEAAQDTRDAIKSLSDETRSNTAAVARADAAIAVIQQTLGELDTLVRTGGGDTVVTQLRLLAEDHEQLRSDHVKLAAGHEDHRNQIGRLQSAASVQAGGAGVARTLVYVFGWLVTTAVAVYAAVKGGH